MVPLQLKDPLELFVKRRKFLPGSGFPCHCDTTLAVKSSPNDCYFTCIVDTEKNR